MEGNFLNPLILLILEPILKTPDAVQHLKQMAALFGYDLTPALPPVIDMPATGSITNTVS